MESLEEFRREIDALDAELVAMLGRRMRLCENVARFKRRNGIPMMQTGRVAAVLARTADLAVQHDLPPSFVTRIYEWIIDESCRTESAIIEGADETAGASR